MFRRDTVSRKLKTCPPRPNRRSNRGCHWLSPFIKLKCACDKSTQKSHTGGLKEPQGCYQKRPKGNRRASQEQPIFHKRNFRSGSPERNPRYLRKFRLPGKHKLTSVETMSPKNEISPESGAPSHRNSGQSHRNSRPPPQVHLESPHQNIIRHSDLWTRAAHIFFDTTLTRTQFPYPLRGESHRHNGISPESTEL